MNHMINIIGLGTTKDKRKETTKLMSALRQHAPSSRTVGQAQKVYVGSFIYAR